MRTITITAFRRPHYFEQLRQSLITNDLRDWSIHIFLEPSDVQMEFERLATGLLAEHDWTIHLNPKRLGGGDKIPFRRKHLFLSGVLALIYTWRKI